MINLENTKWYRISVRHVEYIIKECFWNFKYNRDHALRTDRK